MVCVTGIQVNNGARSEGEFLWNQKCDTFCERDVRKSKRRIYMRTWKYLMQYRLLIALRTLVCRYLRVFIAVISRLTAFVK
jgi:hypothetical protein